MLIPLHRGVNLDRGPHRRREGDGVEVPALDGGRPRPLEFLAQGEVVLDQAVEVEGLLANHAVDDAVAVHAVLDLAALDVPDGPADVLRNGAALGVGHEPARSQSLSQGSYDPHLVRGGDGHVELHETLIANARREVLGADHVRAGLLGLPRLLADGEDGDAARLARAVWQHQGAAHHLVRPPRIYIQMHVRLDALVELRAVELLQELQRLARVVEPRRVYPRLLLQQPLTHRPLSPCSGPYPRLFSPRRRYRRRSGPASWSSLSPRPAPGSRCRPSRGSARRCPCPGPRPA